MVNKETFMIPHYISNFKYCYVNKSIVVLISVHKVSVYVNAEN